ncbi:hypothetical protein B9Z55_026743 [Caenorhabditis nigoni]|uniref:SCP domain-containing protein n=1 Tax=Caenorhabditis nigoni TaxID=1611254 RepID=A0A2G5SHN3_9PELO|nr:hypothetical protein B9Z55_026743 [Caenorhabditis nigoni]
MKATLFVLALLVHNVHSDDRAENLKHFNSGRSVWAKGLQIANMNELVYLPKLEKVLYNQLALTGGCPDSRIIYDASNPEILVEIHLNVKYAKDERDVLKLYGGAGSTHMGYVETKCMVTGEEVKSWAFYKTNIFFSKDPEIHGPPGSKCSSGRSATSDGLCALEKSYTRKVMESYWDRIKRPIGGKHRSPGIFGTMDN